MFAMYFCFLLSAYATQLVAGDRDCEECKVQVDLVIIVDSSTSVGPHNFVKTLQFCKDFLSNVDLDSGNVRVGVVTYSTYVQVHFNLNDYITKADIFTAIDKLPYLYGSTNTADGLKTMRSEMFTPANGDRPGVRNIAMIVTDGVSNMNSRRTIPEAINARKHGIHIYALGIGLTDTRELDGMASEPVEENRFVVADFDELKGLYEVVFSALCPVPRTTQEPATVPVTEKGFKCRRVEPKHNRGPLTAPGSSISMVGGGGYTIQRRSLRQSSGAPVFAAGTLSDISHTGVNTILNNRAKGKRDFQDLNERFANYIEKLRFLKAKNKALVLEIERLKKMKGVDPSDGN